MLGAIGMADCRIWEWRSRFVIAMLQVPLLFLGSGCGYHSVQIASPAPNEQTPLSFLKDGRTTKTDILARLGEPWTLEDRRILVFGEENGSIKLETKSVLGAPQIWEMEKGRILIFALDRRFRTVSSANKVQFHLVLVFGDEDNHLLKRHSLIRIK
jgi:hypothetical protein